MCSNGKRIDKAYDFIPFAENLPQLCISNDDIREHQPCHIEGLAGRHASNQLAVIGHNLPHRNMLSAVSDDIAVDFIRNKPEIMLLHDFRYPLQFFLCPHSAGGVMGVAPEHQLHQRVCRFFGKIIKINCKVAVFINLQIGADIFHTVIFCGMLKIAIRRCNH